MGKEEGGGGTCAMKFITLTLVRRLPMIGSKKNFNMYLVCLKIYNINTSS